MWRKRVQSGLSICLISAVFLMGVIAHSQSNPPSFPACLTQYVSETPNSADAALDALLQKRQETQTNRDRDAEGLVLSCMGEVRLTQGVYPAFQQPYIDARRDFERALLAFREVGDPQNEARAQHQYGYTYYVQRDYNHALPQYQSALRIAQSANDLTAQADILFDTARLYLDRLGTGELQVAHDDFQLAANLYFQTQNPAGHAAALFNLADTGARLWQIDKALEDFRSAATVFNSLGDTHMQAEATYKIARLYHNIGDLTAAQQAYEDAQFLYQQIGDVVGEGRVLSGIGNIYFLRDYDIAGETLNQALDLNNASGDNLGRAVTQNYLGDWYLASGDLSNARSSFQSALQLATNLNATEVQAYAYHGSGRVFAKRAELGQEQTLRPALNDFGEALRLYRDVLGDIYNTRRVFVSQGWAWYYFSPATGDFETWFFAALNKAREIGDKRGEAETLNTLGSVYLQSLDYDQAVTYFRQGLVVAAEIGDDILTGDLNAVLGDIALKRVNFATARDFYETALFNYQSAGVVVQQAVVGSKLGLVAQRLGDFRGAISAYRDATDALYGFSDPRSNHLLVSETLAQTSLRLGSVYLDLNLYDRAQEVLADADSQLNANGDSFNRAEALLRLGDAAIGKHDYGQADSRYGSSQRLAHQTENPSVEALAMSGHGLVLSLSGSGTELEIQRAFEGALDLARKIGDRDAERRIQMSMGDAALDAGDLDGAISRYSSARAVATQSNDARSAAYAMLQVARAQSRDTSDIQGNIALRTFQSVLDGFSALGDYVGEGLALENMGDMALARAQYVTANENFSAMQAAFINAANPIGEARALLHLGEVFQQQRRFDLALKSYNEATDTLTYEVDYTDELTNRLLAQAAEGEVYSARGNLYRLLQEYNSAEQELTQARTILQDPTLFTQVQLSETLSALGALELDRRHFQDALDLFQQAQDIAQHEEASYATGLAVYGTAQVYALDDDDTNTGAAERAFSRALNTFRTDGFNPVQARDVLLRLGDFNQSRDRISDAETWYFQARNEARLADDPVTQGYSALQLGRMYLSRYRYDEAIASFNEAAHQFQLGSDWIGKGEALYATADIYMRRTDYTSALDQYQDALAMYETEGDQVRQAEALTRIGEAYQKQAQLALALNQNFLAQTALAEVKNQPDASFGSSDRIDINLPDCRITLTFNPVTDATEAHVQRNIGVVRMAMGQYNEARCAMQQSLELAVHAGDTVETASTRMLLGQLEFIDGNYETTISIYDTVATEFASVGLPQYQGELYLGQADAYVRQAVVDGALVNIQKESTARIFYQRALDFARQTNDVTLEIQAQEGLGKVFNWLQQNDESQARFVAALDLANQVNNPQLHANILVDLGILAEKRGEITKAIDDYRQAVDLLEDVFVDIRIEPGQIAFASENILPYHRLVDLYMKQGDAASAFAYSERGRARALLFQLGSEHLDFSAIPGGDMINDWEEQRVIIRDLHTQVTDKIASLEGLNPVQREPIQNNIDDLNEQIADIEEGLSGLRERIDTSNAVLAQVAHVNPRSLSDIQSEMDNETTMLSYYIVPRSSVNEGSVYAFVIRDNDFSAQKLDIDPDTLMTQVHENVVGERTLSPIGEIYVGLYDQLIRPIMSKFGTGRLIIVPHGPLNNVPFATLASRPADASGGEFHFLGDEHVLTYASSATFYSLLREDRAPQLGSIVGSALVYGNPANPKLDKAASSERDIQLGSLPGAATEAQEVARLLQVDVSVDQNATETKVWQNSASVHLIHIAAHGVFDPKNPLTSYLALADDADNDGSLQVREIYSLALRRNEPLVVLSACDTAKGGETASDDLQSLSGAFLIGGARSVVASMWKVDDAAAEALMTAFYENLINQHMPTAEALQAAQATIRADRRWAAPRYWAAFVLVGLPD